jgi:glutamyl-tRNA synthetase
MNKLKKPAYVRFAPSPTGRLHIGGARTALYNYLIARQTGGKFILRIEDTDQKRYDPHSEREIIDGLHWLGLDWDEGPDVGGPHTPYHQSKRKEIYLEYSQKLVNNGFAYRCFCTPQRLESVRRQQLKNKQSIKYDGFCRLLTDADIQSRLDNHEPYVIRFKMPKEGSVTVKDRIRGEITIENKNLDDYILVKSDGLALYHLAAMVDDHLMGITHVFRSAEWLSTFPLHVHIYRAFGWKEPEWVHLSIFLKPSGKGKMSKRESAEMAKDGQSIFLTDLESLGYLPEAVINWLALMGWSFDDKTEFFTTEDLIQKFSLDKLNPAPAAINFTKLDHFNRLHIRNLQLEELSKRLKPFFAEAGIQASDKILNQIAPILQERIHTLDDAIAMAGFFFKDDISPTYQNIIPKRTTPTEALKVATRAHEILQPIPEFRPVIIEQPLRELADELGLKVGQVFGVLRGAVTGQQVSPPLLESMEIIGREKVMQRIYLAILILKRHIG